MKIDQKIEDLFFPDGSEIKLVWDSLQELKKFGIYVFAEFNPETQKVEFRFKEKIKPSYFVKKCNLY